MWDIILSAFKSRCTILCLCNSFITTNLPSNHWWYAEELLQLSFQECFSFSRFLAAKSFHYSIRVLIFSDHHFSRHRSIWANLDYYTSASILAQFQPVSFWFISSFNFFNYGCPSCLTPSQPLVSLIYHPFHDIRSQMILPLSYHR